MPHLLPWLHPFLALTLWLGASAASSEVPSPVVEGPVSGGAGQPFLASTSFDLAEVGYEQAEYFVSGTATAYTGAAPLTSDGRWTALPGETASYKTRIVVYRPVEAAAVTYPKHKKGKKNQKKSRRFNGTVIVEWLNVSGGLDSAPDWLMAHTELIREGYAWVGVSAQFVGVEGGPGIGGLPSLPIKKVDPERYGSLSHPGDSFSYDIFAQIGQAMRRPVGASPLGDLEVRRVIAVGESQSAFRLTTYVNAIHPQSEVYDGFLIHSRGRSAAPLSEAPQPSIPAPTSVRTRTDLRVPVLTFETETDLILLGYAPDRQPDSAWFRLWEVAGTAHADTYTIVVGATDLGDSPAAAELVLTTMPIGLFECAEFINSGPHHFVLKAAFAALDRWVRRGTAPPPAPRIVLTNGDIARDAHGNALGGIRTPQVDVPIATLSGLGQTGSILCLLFGTTVPFDADELDALYPDHQTYVSAFARATRRALRAGHIRRADAKLMKQAARASDIGR